MAIFCSTFLDTAAENIPKTSPFPEWKAKPWFDEDCQAAKTERNKANRLPNKHPSVANSMHASLIQSRTKKLFKQKKRDSWKNYVSSVNVNTPCKKVLTLTEGGGRPSSVMSLGVTSVGGHSHGHPASPIGVGSSWEDIDPRSPEPLVVRGGWLWLIWVVRWTT